MAFVQGFRANPCVGNENQTYSVEKTPTRICSTNRFEYILRLKAKTTLHPNTGIFWIASKLS